MTPEARARQSIDALLDAAGWGVRELKQGRVVSDVDRYLSIIREGESEVDANLQRAQVQWQSPLAKAFGIHN